MAHIRLGAERRLCLRQRTPALSCLSRRRRVHLRAGDLHSRGNAFLHASPALVGSERAYATTYGQQALAFGGLMGTLVALFAYLLAIGWALKDGALLRLSALVLAFMIYVAADRAFLETALIPGAFDLSRMASLSGSLLTFAAWLSFEACYLKVRTYRPLLEQVNRIGVVILLICAVQVVVEFVADIRMIRLYSSYIGLVALAAGVGLALAMMFNEWRRSLLFLICWFPAIAGGAARLLLDAADGLAPHPLAVNAVYLGAGLSLLTFGIVTSLDIQARERSFSARPNQARLGFAALPTAPPTALGNAMCRDGWPI